MTTEEREICKAIKDMASRLGLAVETFGGENPGFDIRVLNNNCLIHEDDIIVDSVLNVSRYTLPSGDYIRGLEFYPNIEHFAPDDRVEPITDNEGNEIFKPTDPYLLSLESQPWQIIRDDADPDTVFFERMKDNGTVKTAIGSPVRLTTVSPGKLESCLVEFLDRLNRTDMEWLANKIKYSGDTLEERFNNEAQSVHD